MPTDHFPPVFATNRPEGGETVAAEVNRLLHGVRTQYATPGNVAIATAYLNPQGFNLIAEEIEKAPAVRLLLGADPEPAFARRAVPGDDLAGIIEKGVTNERDMMGFTLEADTQAHRLVAWLKHAAATGQPAVEVRRFSRGFLHGKAFMVEHTHMPAVLAGSSNLTLAGLSWNRELNLGYPSGQHTHLVIDWFNELWEESELFDLAGFYEARWLPHPPWIVFLRMLHELYGDQIEDDFAERMVLQLTGFQRDGVTRAQRLLNELGGVLICDEVGLGKTFIAGELIAQATRRRRQDVLIVCPAALKASTWEPFLRRYDFTRRVEVRSYDDLRIMYEERDEEFHALIDRCALVVIDEAHNLRNRSTLRHDAVNALLSDEHPKNVVLLTATPVNNSLDDLESLVSLFVRNDGQFAHLNIPSIAAYIRDAKAQDPDTLSPEHLFDLMDQVAVRRTRKFVKDQYTGDTIVGPNGTRMAVEFPTPVLERLEYGLSPDGLTLLNAVLYALQGQDYDPLVEGDMARALRARCADPKRLSMARYMPSLYAPGRPVERRQVSGSALLESALLKRFESSGIALKNTIRKMLESHEAFLRALGEGYVITGSLLTEYESYGDSIEEFLEDIGGLEAGVEEASLFDVEALRKRVLMDIELLADLEILASKAISAGEPKVKTLVSFINQVSKDSQHAMPDGPSPGDRRKIIVFSSYADTIEYLREQVVQQINSASRTSPLVAYQRRVPEAVCGSKQGISQRHRANVIAQFAPRTAGEVDALGNPTSTDRYDILFATDVLAEGVNLQQAGHMVSLDLPWNPMRLVQRHGRIDRIGSEHRKVKIGCFFPEEHLEELLELEETLQRKIAYANAAIGMGEVIPGQRVRPNLDIVHHDIAADLNGVRDLAAGNADILVNRGGSAALSGEEYRRRLDRAMRDDNVQRDVLALPFGSGSGFVSTRLRQAGWVFCVKIGEHAKPWFRFVLADPAVWTPKVGAEGRVVMTDDTLTALVAADPGGEATEQHLPDAARLGVFEAWAHAQRDIYESWTWMTDPKNLRPEVPLALREAAELVYEHGSHLGEAQNDLLQRLNAKWDKRIVDEVRLIVRSDDLPRKRLERLAAFVREAGLRIPEKVKPLPPIELADIRVVCWMAVVPEASPS
jgi:hypothetical protein